MNLSTSSSTTVAQSPSCAHRRAALGHRSDEREREREREGGDDGEDDVLLLAALAPPGLPPPLCCSKEGKKEREGKSKGGRGFCLIFLL